VIRRLQELSLVVAAIRADYAVAVTTVSPLEGYGKAVAVIPQDDVVAVNVLESSVVITATADEMVEMVVLTLTLMVEMVVSMLTLMVFALVTVVIVARMTI
jgi:hypothetical protein